MVDAMASTGINTGRPYGQALARLRESGLRPTRQRLALARLLLDGRDRHVSAEQLHEEAEKQGVRVSLATVYNTLHQFTAVGLLREVVIDPNRSYFDTNVTAHHHFFVEDDGRLLDIPADEIDVDRLPTPPEGTEIKRVEVVVRLRNRK